MAQYKGKKSEHLSFNAVEILNEFERGRTAAQFHDFTKRPENYLIIIEEIKARLNLQGLKTSKPWAERMAEQIRSHFQSDPLQPAQSKTKIMAREHREILIGCVKKTQWRARDWESWHRDHRIQRIGWLHSIIGHITNWLRDKTYTEDDLIAEISTFFGVDTATPTTPVSPQSEAPAETPSPDPGQEHNNTNTTPHMDYSNVPIARPTLVFGEDVAGISEARAMQLIKANNDTLKELDSLGVTSTRLEQRKADIKAVNAELVKRLDSFARPAETVEA